jgi:hypothetical protein
MGFPERRAEPGSERRAEQHGTRASRSEDRYGTKPGPRSGCSNEPLYAPSQRPTPAPAPAAARRVGRTDVTQLLGRSVLEARTQRICAEYGLVPSSGAALSRSYLARETGVELAADAHGTVTTVFLHFHGDDGFEAYRGEIPGGGGHVARRSSLWAMLGRPDETGDPYRDRFLGDYGPWDRWLLTSFTLHAQYATDAETLDRITVSPPDHFPRAA